jgi:sulfur-carrier protein
MIVAVRLAGPLRPDAEGQTVVRVELPAGAPATVGELLDRLERRHPGLAGRVRDERGAIRRHVNVFVGADHIRELGGLAAPLDGTMAVSILPAVSGGAQEPSSGGSGSPAPARQVPAHPHEHPHHLLGQVGRGGAGVVVEHYPARLVEAAAGLARLGIGLHRRKLASAAPIRPGAEGGRVGLERRLGGRAVQLGQGGGWTRAP